jgi:hypothetical protein
MDERPATITPTRPAASSWVLAVGAAFLLMAMLLTAFGPGTIEPTTTRSVGTGAPTAIEVEAAGGN